MSDQKHPVDSQRWWLDPELVQRALPRAGRLRTPSVPVEQAISRALAQGEELQLDLDDPTQRDFGDYELLEQIGRGGMGVVYRATQRELDREVAIKLLSAGHHASGALVESLRREAHHAARLNHPNIVVVHEMGRHGGLVFYAMQLVRGCNLSHVLADGPLPPRRAARLLRTLAEAVHYAHRLGVLHLDLKPGNILLDENGVPLIADFGLARAREAPSAMQPGGTPSYMAPEQAQPDGTALQPATDVWALGAILYEMLTGDPPFDAGDPAATLRLLREGTVRRPSRTCPVPADLEAVCMHCLARAPSARYPDARALADDLGRFLDGHAVSVRPLGLLARSLRWVGREPAVAGLAGFALAAGAVAWSLQRRQRGPSADPPPTRH